MKKFLLMALAGVIALGGLDSCKGDDEVKGVSITGGSAEQTVYADDSSGTGSVKISTSAAWTSSVREGTRMALNPGTGTGTGTGTNTDASWLTITPSAGNSAGNYMINIATATNYTGADRTATVTISSTDGGTATITVTQKGTKANGETPSIAVTGVTLNKKSLSLPVGATETLTPTLNPAEATNKTVTWSTSNEEVASVEDGVVTALKGGTAKITVTTADGAKKDECTVTVVSVPLTLTVDRPAIKANGNDKATFTIMQGDRDVTDIAQVCHLGGQCLLSPEFSTNTAGSYQFYASFATDPENKSAVVTVVATDDSAFDSSKTPHKNVTFFTFTATWCGPCYTFKGYMKKLEADYAGNLVALNFYTGNQYGANYTSDPKVRSDVTATFDTQLQAEGRFNVGGFPTAFAELDLAVGTPGYVPTEAQARAAYSKYIAYAPKTGIKVSPAIAGNKINVDVTVGAKMSDTYQIGALLVEDNVVCFQNGGGNQYNHTNVLRAKAMDNIFGETLGAITAGGTQSKQYSFDITSSYNRANLSIVIYTLCKNSNGRWAIDNSVKVPANGFLGFMYADEAGQYPAGAGGSSTDWGDGGTVRF